MIDSFFTHAISLGIGDRWEIGTIPVFYGSFTPHFHTFNATLKYNLIKSPGWAFALGYMVSYFAFDLVNTGDAETRAKNPFPTDHYRILLHGLSLISSHALTEKLTLGLRASAGYQQTISPVLKSPFMFYSHPETFMDASYKISENLFWTSGISRSTYLDDGINRELYQWGLGGTFTWRRPHRFISRPSLGAHYLTGNHRLVLLWGTSFY